MKFPVILMLLLFSLSLSAQQFELGNVTKQELQEKFHPADTSAPAAILHKKGKIYFKYLDYYWVVVHEVDVRIKIYKKGGYKYANHELYYRNGRSANNRFSDAYTYNLIGDSIVKTKAGVESEFIELVNKNVESKKIILPNVIEGSVVEYKCITVTSGVSYLPTLYFQHIDMPINNIVYDVALPAYFTYHSIVSGDLKINKSPQETGFRDGFQENRITYSASGVTPLKIQPYVDNIENYRSVVKHELAAQTSDAGEQTHYTSSWKSFVKHIYDDENFGKQLSFESYFRKDINALLTVDMTQEQKAQVIFKYVQSRMKWDNYDGYFCYDDIKKAYSNRRGNVAEINLMLVAMLKYAGIIAHPVLISTRSNGIPVYPSFSVFNYVIASAQIGAKTVLMDATSKNTAFGFLHPRALNQVGRKIQPDGNAIEVNLVPVQSSKTIFSVLATIDSKGGISGMVRNQRNDYAALIFRESKLLDDVEKYVGALEKTFHGAEISNYTLQNENDPEKPLIEQYDFSHNGLADLTDNRIFFNPMLFFADEENPFTAEKRLYPIDFTFPYQYKYLITLNLPTGYLVESVPEPLSINFGVGIAGFVYAIDAKSNQLQLSITFDINQAIIAKENYNPLKEFYQKAVSKQKEKVVLKKA
jgi:hypothetical protein